MDPNALHLSLEMLRYYCGWSLDRHAAPIIPSLLDLLVEELRFQLDANVEFRPAMEYALSEYRLFDDEATGIPWRSMYAAVLGKIYGDNALRSKAWDDWVKKGKKRSPRRSPTPVHHRQFQLL